MKKYRRRITANTNINNNRPMFTPSDVALLLSCIQELNGYPISLNESPEGVLEFIIGDSIYEFADDSVVY